MLKAKEIRLRTAPFLWQCARILQRVSKVFFWTVSLLVTIWVSLSILDVRFPIHPETINIFLPSSLHLSFKEGSIAPSYLKARFSCQEIQLVQEKMKIFQTARLTGRFNPLRWFLGGMFHHVALYQPVLTLPQNEERVDLGEEDVDLFSFMDAESHMLDYTTLSVESGTVKYDEKKLFSHINAASQHGGISLRLRVGTAGLASFLKEKKISLHEDFKGDIQLYLSPRKNEWRGICQLPQGAVKLDGHPHIYRLKKSQLDFIYARHSSIEMSLHSTLEHGAKLSGNLKLLRGKSGPHNATFNAALHAVPTDYLTQLWPGFLGKNAYTWVKENLSQGMVQKAWISGRFDLEKKNLSVEKLGFDGGMKLQGIDVQYHDKMPKIYGSDSDVTFTKDKFHFRFKKGKTQDIQLLKGDMIITELQAVDQFAKLKIDLQGPLRQALELLDLPHLHYVQDFGLDPQESSGQMETTIVLDFPLETTLKMADIHVLATAKMKNVTLNKLPIKGKHKLKEGSFDLTLTDHLLTLTGEGKVPYHCKIRLVEPLKKEDKQPQTIDISVPRINTTEMRAFGIPGTILGDLAGALTLTLRADKRTDDSQKKEIVKRKPQKIEAHFLAREGDLVIAFFKELEITPEHQLAFSVQGTLDDDHPAGDWEGSVSHGNDTYLKSAFSFSPEGEIERFEIKSTPHIDGQLSLIADKRQKWHISVKGKKIDLDDILSLSTKTAGDSSFPIDGAVMISMSDLLYEGEPFLQSMHGNMLLKQGIWIGGTLEGGMRNKEADTLQLTMMLNEQKERQLSLTSNHFGRLLKQLNKEIDLDGEKMVVRATKPAAKTDAPWQGDFTITNAKLINLPVMTTVLRLLSPFAMFDFAKDGDRTISFSQFQGDFIYDDQLLSLFSAFGIGLNLSLSVEGDINFREKLVDLHGAVTPFSVLNSLLSHIPIVGSLLTGGKGEGFLSISYSASGPMDKVKASVNPMSILTPGFTRNLMKPFSKRKIDAVGKENSSQVKTKEQKIK
ncbi:DUF3971 domain-containing protein [Alphaproteobacteria bacterium]|nr:DUF3971 domain-containing protein [Alphaproteobacteria bacterium]